MIRRAGQRIGGKQTRGLVSLQRRGGMRVRRKGGGQFIGMEAPVANGDTQHQRTGSIGAHDPGMRGATAQRVIDEITDGRAIASPGEAIVEAPGLQRLGHRPMARLHIGQHLDGGGKSTGQTHQLLPATAIRTSRTASTSHQIARTTTPAEKAAKRRTT